jgi:intersectin
MLADMNADGKMDRREFAVAMHLIKRKLQGYELPSSLPLSLVQSVDSVVPLAGGSAGPRLAGALPPSFLPAAVPVMGVPLIGQPGKLTR